MAKSSSGDWDSVHPYLRPKFYTLWWFSTDMKYTEKTRAEFARRELQELNQLAKRAQVPYHYPRKDS